MYASTNADTATNTDASTDTKPKPPRTLGSEAPLQPTASLPQSTAGSRKMVATMRMEVKPDLTLADQHTLIAQLYAGYFVGYHYTAGQQKDEDAAIRIDYSRPWTEPLVISDNCIFCRALTDESAIRRVAGYQHRMDKEVTDTCSALFSQWCRKQGFHFPTEPARVKKFDQRVLQDYRRRFINEHPELLDKPSMPMVDLPLRLKRKLCIEWNHVYTGWMAHDPDLRYDPETQEFYKEVADKPVTIYSTTGELLGTIKP